MVRKVLVSQINIATAVQAAVAADGTIVAAALAAIEDAAEGLDVITSADPRLPAKGDPEDFRVVDQAGAVAFRVAPDGVTHASEVRSTNRRLGGVEEAAEDADRWRIMSRDGRTALEVRPDGSTYIGYPVWGPNAALPGGGGGGGGGVAISKVRLIIGCGQSNMVAPGMPFSARLDPVVPRIQMAVWTGTSITGLEPATVPLSTQVGASGFSLLSQIAREHYKVVGEDTAIVVLNAAVGGSGLVSPNVQGVWKIDYTGANPHLYEIAKDAITATIARISTKYPGAGIEPWLYWHQGESDGSISESSYGNALDALVDGLRTHLADATIPFTAGGLVPEHMPTSGGTLNVRKALLGVQSRLQYTAYTDGIVNGGGSQNVEDEVHYARGAAERLGRNMFAASMRAAAATATSTPHKPLDVSATFIGGKLTARWSEPDSRYTNFVVQYRLNGGSWVTATRLIPEDTQQVVTGLSSTAVVEVRVATVNGALTSDYTVPVTAIGA